MALLKCSECGHDVSDRATACPKCGNPIVSAVDGVAVQTVEQTAKKYKGQQAIGCGLIVLGFMGAMSAGSSGSTISILVILAGFILFIVARASAWWRHG